MARFHSVYPLVIVPDFACQSACYVSGFSPSHDGPDRPENHSLQKQIEKGGPVTVTDSKMTRFIMSIEEAARLVIDSASIAKGGEVFITKMPVVRIIDLAEVMINELAPEYGYKPEEIEIKEIGVKPGEKLYEELMSHEETRRAVELDHYFSVLPAFMGLYKDIWIL